MDQVIAFQSPADPSPLAIPVSAQNPLPVVFVDAPVGTVTQSGLRPMVIAFVGADGQPLQVPVSDVNPLPVVLL